MQVGAVGLGSLLVPRRARAKEWRGYRDALVIDAMGGPDDPDVTDENGALGPTGLAAARSSGLTAVSVTLGGGDSSLDDLLTGLGWCERECDAHAEVFVRVRRGADLRAAKSSGRLGLVYNAQGLAAIGHDLGKLDLLHNLGLRVAQLTYNNRNLVGDGCLEPADGGLSRFGHAVVEKLNTLRMVVDGAHAGGRVIAQAIAESKAPIAVTHTGCVGVVPHPRNLSDDNLRALAKRGGVAGIFFMPFLRSAGQPMADDVVRHLEHAVDVAGEDHVGIGTDGGIAGERVDEAWKKRFAEFVRQRKAQGIAAPGESEDVYNFVPDLNTPRKLETLAELLAARGHKDARIGKILGGNFARLFSEVWG